MSKTTKKIVSEKLILSGDPAKDISSFLLGKDKHKNFNYGVNLIRVYSKNHRLYLRLKEIHRTNPDLALEKLILNLNIISYKWKK